MTHAPAVWYLMRGSGVVALLLLTLSLALGIATSKRWRARGAALYVTTTLHRNASLLAVAFLALHVLTAVADADAAVSLAGAILPFGSHLALGALGLDLVAALVVTSLLRRRIPHRTWRAIHWSAYLAWPVAVAHTLGMGSDAGTWWLGAVVVCCFAAVGAAVAWRFAQAAAPARGMG